MSLPRWLADLLLESPAPPPNWLPGRSERLADARITLRRRFGQGRASGRPGHRMRDLASVYPLYGTSRTVPGPKIESELEVDITTINPPIVQGWAAMLGLMTIIVTFGGILSLGVGGSPYTGWLLIVPIVVCMLAAAIAGHTMRVIELDERGVWVRRWSEVWRGRDGTWLGPPTGLRASMRRPRRLDLWGEGRSTSLGIRLWPHTAVMDVLDELPLWGVDLDPGPGDRHHRRHPDR